MNINDLHLIQFSDPHLTGDAAGTLRGIATLPALRAAIEHASATGPWPPHAILVTGDLVQDDPRGYAHIREVFEDLDAPVLCLPGNHDDPEALARELRQAPFVAGGAVDLGDWRIVMLDSSVPGEAFGHLGEGQLAALESALGTTDRHALVCLHHHPVPMGSAWLDRLAVNNAERFFRVIDAHPNVRAICWGHVHQEFEDRRNGVRLFGTPATCAQFLPHAVDFGIDPLRPGGYRRLTLRPDGIVNAHVSWVDTSTALLHPASSPAA